MTRRRGFRSILVFLGVRADPEQSTRSRIISTVGVALVVGAILSVIALLTA